MTPRETIAAFLESQNTLALATLADPGLARVTPLYYLAGKDLRLYWFSSAASEHSRSLRANPQAAVTVYRPSRSWREIRGVQMRGRVSQVKDKEERRAVQAIYAERFALGRILRAALAQSRLYVFEPEWARYIDNSRRFRRRCELHFT